MFQNEATLWKAFRQGNIIAFERIYETHAAVLLSYGKRLCNDHDLVKDLVQDIFVDLWARRQTLRDLHTIRFYLFRVMRNRLARQHQQTPTLVSDALLAEQEDLLTPSIEVLIAQQEGNQRRQNQLQRAITQLPARQREAIMLAFFDEFSNDDIAAIMGINQQSVSNHINRALNTLREWVSRAPMLLLLVDQWLA